MSLHRLPLAHHLWTIFSTDTIFCKAFAVSSRCLQRRDTLAIFIEEQTCKRQFAGGLTKHRRMSSIIAQRHLPASTFVNPAKKALKLIGFDIQPVALRRPFGKGAPAHPRKHPQKVAIRAFYSASLGNGLSQGFGMKTSVRWFSSTSAAFAINYTEMEKKLIEDMYRHGRTTAEIVGLLKQGGRLRTDPKSVRSIVPAHRAETRAEVGLNPANNSPKRWTSSESEKVKLLFAEGVTIKNIAKELNRTITSVRSHKSRGGFASTDARAWTEAETELLKQRQSAGISVPGIAKELSRTQASVDNKRREILGSKQYHRQWSDLEKQELAELWRQGLSDGEITQRLSFKTNVNNVAMRRYSLGLTSFAQLRRPRWTKAEEDEMRRLVNMGLAWEEIATRLGTNRTAKAIESREYELRKKRKRFAVPREMQ